ncbi:deoxyribodipyrimidine photo-lyase [bacterium]|nr:MAG: deoxyribodipyrimidine photo-lyase [bacterium]
MAQAKPVHIVWHRAELRTHDHPALNHALELAKADGGVVVPVVIIDDAIFSRSDLTPRRQAHFLENVRALRESYRSLGANLVVRRGDVVKELEMLVREVGHVASAHVVSTYTPYAKKRDEKARKMLAEHKVEWHAHGGQYTHEPGEVLTNEGKRYGVFGAYRKKWVTLDKPDIVEAPEKMAPLPTKINVGDIPRVESDIVLPEAGEDAALGRLEWFLKNGEKTYEKTRDEPGREDSTSRLSYYFNIGALSPRLAYYQSKNEKWRAELTWWDFYADVMERCPESATQEFRAKWLGFPWRDGHDKASKADLEKWKNAETGYPLVDAGMRELNQTGFMQNRVRMVCASFLCKHLLIDWRVGEEIFRGLLLCGDRNQNVGNWQWVAGCGVDPSPYFRIFNPTSQGKKFDSNGDYVRRWIPELKDVPAKSIYEPWKMRDKPKGYPTEPIIGLEEGRDRFAETARQFLREKRDEAKRDEK